ncbi:MAG: MBOAT family O-acyltransferase [Bacteroidia bacterium]|nr:MBOAT family O-acyltransferase [Bacteroidia bacterium]
MPEALGHVLQALGHGSEHTLFFTTRLFVAVFTALFALQWALSGKPRWRVALLSAFSLYFYWKAGGWFVFAILGTATYDWWLGQRIYDSPTRSKRGYYYASLALNLGLLAWFKYQFFFLGTYDWLLTGTYTPAPLGWLLPVGISYYTFKSLSYIIGLWQEEVEAPERSYLNYLCYVTFFPSLLAGPITRAASFLGQLRQPYRLTQAQVGAAVFLFLTGLVKKLVIADYLAANFVGRVFDYPESYTGLEILLAAFSYGFQLYYDFSGYTDMALGVGLLLGLELGRNFNEPFKAQNVTDFWRRWHITLSTWFNDYVFLPLNFRWRRRGKLFTVLAVTLTFVLSGLWHGPAWTFVLWGLSHGLAIGWDTLTQPQRRRLAQRVPPWLYRSASVLLTYCFLAATYLLFVADDLGQLRLMLTRIFTAFDGHLVGTWLAGYWRVAAMLAVAVVVHYLPTAWKAKLKHRFTQLHWALQALAVATIVLCIYQFTSSEVQPFIYLQF